MKQVFLATAPERLELCTDRLQRLIDDCAAQDGGQVRLQAGIYRTGTLYLKSGVELRLDAGALLLGSTDWRDYSNNCPMPSKVEGVPHWYNALITAVDAQDIAISGEGVIDGADCQDPHGEQDFRGPHAISFFRCANVRVQGVTIVRCACYNLMFERCEDVLIERVRVFGGQDGLRLGACARVTMTGCDIRSGDDCIGGSGNRDVSICDTALNTPGGSTVQMDCVNLLMKNCVLWGSGEYPALFKNDKRYSPSHTALVIGFDYEYTRDQPSDNWLIEDVLIENVERLLCYDHDLYSMRRSIPIRNITLRRVRAVNLCKPSIILGGEDAMTRLTMEDCRFSCADDASEDGRTLLKADHFDRIELNRCVFQGFGEKPLEFSDGGEVLMEDLWTQAAIVSDSVRSERLTHFTCRQNAVSTHASRYVSPTDISIYLPKLADEAFRGPLPYISKPEI